MTGRALVTGGSAGLGYAFCAALAADGYDVVNVDRDAPAEGHPATHWPCDLSGREDVEHLLSKIEGEELFDIVILNAGISATGKFEEIEPDAHARVLSVNAEAPMVICAHMLAKRRIVSRGHIAFVSSLSHFIGYPGAASYAASKDAVTVYANAIRKAQRTKFGIKITTAFPGPLKTDHAARHAPEGADASKRMTPHEAAKRILADIKQGKAQSLPGGGAKAFALLGRIAPKPITFAMKKIIYEKLDKTVAD